ncbi:adenylyltransferase [Bacillus sp. J14TS2]|uniref:aminoglycoside adenylyltransferase domain-containing protein n=1 Tax=Bacillus sp. J14TS2 TaxID=2807188 RepID=UPI001B03CFCA|nr:aminoglycoside adenylyltransferase domain-containing protein [Bacillus sp. J14TS2]GIN72024.1 adenylyltransferase [Bacillus sp. J14TS2]
MPQVWGNCDNDIKQFVIELNAILENHLGDTLVGIYLHGSLAMGSYYRPKSDIDVIVVVDQKLPETLSENVGIAIARHAEKRPTIGNIELSVITSKVAKEIPIPTPYELHYSSDWHETILQKKVDYRTEKIDEDLPSHLMYVVQRGICLGGQSIEDVFGEMDWDDFMAAVLDDLKWILEDDHIIETPFYSVLNICRVFQLLHERKGTVHSKDEGGEWGLTHFPKEYHPIIQQAIEVYHSSNPIEEQQRKMGGREWEREQLLALRDYARVLMKEGKILDV